MTISQHRVIAIINSGRDFEVAFGRLVLLIDEQRNSFKAGQISAEDALEIIYMAAGDRLLHDPSKARATLEAEFRHFKANWSRNERNRIKAERKRRNAGIAKRQDDNSLFIQVTKPQAPASNAKELFKPSPDPPQARMDQDEDNPEDVEGGMFGEAPQALPSDEELRAQAKQMVEEAMRKYNAHEKP